MHASFDSFKGFCLACCRWMPCMMGMGPLWPLVPMVSLQACSLQTALPAPLERAAKRVMMMMKEMTLARKSGWRMNKREAWSELKT